MVSAFATLALDEPLGWVDVVVFVVVGAVTIKETIRSAFLLTC